jgi:hypothetical protein
MKREVNEIDIPLMERCIVRLAERAAARGAEVAEHAIPASVSKQGFPGTPRV